MLIKLQPSEFSKTDLSQAVIITCLFFMVENLYVMASNGEGGVDVREKGIFKNALAKIKCAVCPECGYV